MIRLVIALAAAAAGFYVGRLVTRRSMMRRISPFDTTTMTSSNVSNDVNGHVSWTHPWGVR